MLSTLPEALARIVSGVVTVGMPVFSASVASVAVGLLLGGGLCVVARWMWKREEKENK